MDKWEKGPWDQSLMRVGSWEQSSSRSGNVVFKSQYQANIHSRCPPRSRKEHPEVRLCPHPGTHVRALGPRQTWLSSARDAQTCVPFSGSLTG